MRLSAVCALAFCCAFAPGLAAFAQESAPPEVRLETSVVTLDRNRLFEETLFGRALLAQLEAASADLLSENRRLEAALEAEERALTQRRVELPIEEFRALAREFDTRVEELRVAQEAKSRALARSRDLEQQRFFEAAVPVLGGLMQDLGAVAIIDRSAVILSFDRIDITAQAIARLDEELGDGAMLEPVPELGPGLAPEAAPQPAPAALPDFPLAVPPEQAEPAPALP